MVKKSVSEKSTQALLLENFINLQKKLTESIKEVKDLKTNVSDLLDIFKKAEQELKQQSKISLNPDIEEKLENISDQNKAIIEAILAIGESLKVETNIVPEKEKRPVKKTEKPKHEEESDDSDEDSESESYDMEPLPEFNF